VLKLLLAEASRLAEEVASAESLALHKRMALEGLGRLWFTTDGRPALIRLPAAAARLLNDLPLNHPDRPRAGMVSDPAGLAERWREVAVALLQDASAPMPE
jgi:hypothetical protein